MQREASKLNPYLKALRMVLDGLKGCRYTVVDLWLGMVFMGVIDIEWIITISQVFQKNVFKLLLCCGFLDASIGPYDCYTYLKGKFFGTFQPRRCYVQNQTL